jgi:hypothetical protein
VAPVHDKYGGADLKATRSSAHAAVEFVIHPVVLQTDLRSTRASVFREAERHHLFHGDELTNSNVTNVFLAPARLTTTATSAIRPRRPAVQTYGQDYADMYRHQHRLHEQYCERWRIGTRCRFHGPPRQIRLGVRLEY